MRTIARVARPVLIAVSGATLVLAVIISASRGEPTSAADASVPAPVKTVSCPDEAVAIERRVECGFVKQPLDREKPAGQKINIYFELYPHSNRARPTLATVVSIEGGPGYPTAADRDARAELWQPVSDRHDLLLVDLRGTGESDALGCKAFANSSVDYIERAGRCATQIGPTRDLYSTSQAVQDIEEVLRSLDAGQVDMYGDSYGSYAAQAFALRYPERLRSLTLDGTYLLPGSDAAAADLAEAGRLGLGLTCDRSPGCPAAARDDPVALVSRFAERVRADPIDGFGPDGDGTRTRVHLDADALVQIFASGYYFPGLWRDLPAALLAADEGNLAPILRLGAETVTVDAGGEDPPSSSEALYLAVICHDYPELWDLDTPIADRPAEVEQRLAAYPDGTFEPFTGSEWTGTDFEGWLACLRWPSPVRSDPPDPPDADYPDVPTLVLNGDLDTITSSSGAREVARRFPNSTYVDVQNSFHVTAISDKDDCASRIYVHFVETLNAGNTSCARKIAEPHLVPLFASRLQDVAAADPAKGDASRRSDRQLAAAAAATIADVVARWWVNYDATSVGLHGGKWSYEGDDPIVFDLKAVELVPGVEVSGTASWNIDKGSITAHVTTRADDPKKADLRIEWSTRERRATATLTGDVAGRKLAATMPAP
jgi:pimeloyl-ACP methyl ester carboxylesterase